MKQKTYRRQRFNWHRSGERSPKTESLKKMEKNFENRGSCCNFGFANCELNMRKHNGMRPQDVAILLKIIALDEDSWLMKDLALSLRVSASEVTESLERSAVAGLIAADKSRVMRDNLLEFLVYGLRYVFPVQLGPIMQGIATAHSAAPLNTQIVGYDTFVWPYLDGPDRGPSIVPLIATVPQAALEDPRLYQLLALVETLRVGHVREKTLAAQHLEQLLWSTPIIA
jgi:hypothetical protein